MWYLMAFLRVELKKVVCEAISQHRPFRAFSNVVIWDMDVRCKQNDPKPGNINHKKHNLPNFKQKLCIYPAFTIDGN